jgi:hypothetical protein
MMRRVLFTILFAILVVGFIDFTIAFFKITNLPNKNPKTTAFIQNYQSQCNPPCLVTQK